MVDLLAGQPASAGPLPAPQPDAPLVIGYTSGTTGRPKGAVLTQGSIAALARMNALSYRLPIGSVAAMTGSMAFVAVVPAHVFSHFYVRGTVRLLGDWTVPSLLDTIEQHRVTFTYIPSPLLDRVRRRGRGLPRAVGVAGDGAALRVQGLLRTSSRGWPASSAAGSSKGWGMTENSGGLMTATTPARRTSPDRAGCRPSGVRWPEVEVEVIDRRRPAAAPRRRDPR